MKQQKSRWGRGLAAGLSLVLAMSLTGCVAERLRADAQERMRAGDYEGALDSLEAGQKEHPDSALLRSGTLSARNEALARLVAEAAADRAIGRLDSAEALLKRAQRFDTGGKRVEALLADLAVERRQRQALAQAEALAPQQPNAALLVLNTALKDNPRQAELLALKRRLEAQQRQTQTKALQQGLNEARPISLDFRDANLRTVLDVVSRHSGINFVLDKDVRSDVRVSIYLRSAKLEDAVDLITSTHGLAKKLLDGQTMLIYPNTPEKQREYQEQVIRVFHLASAEAKGAAAFLRSMLKLKEPFVDERANMLALRETPENIELAERLLALYDTPEPEVVLELEVIEVRASRLLDLGVKFPDTLSLTPLGPSGAAGGITAGNIESLTRNNVGMSFGGLLLNFKREIGDFNTLANPRIRARNKEKAKVLVGDKVPVVTTTTGQGGFVADSVNYLDVGLKLEVEPTVFADDEVAIKVGLEVSSVSREVRSTNGTLAYQIGTRNANTTLRLRDGETQLLAGLISREERSSASRLPGLGDLPVAGRLFSSQRDETTKTELVLAITPRIVRNLRLPDASQSELWVGTESATRLRAVGGRIPSADAPVAEAKLGSPGATAGPGPSAGTPTGPAMRPMPVGPGASAAPSAAPLAPRLETPPAAQAPPPLTLSWRAPTEAKVGEVFHLSLMLNSLTTLRGAPMTLAYNKALVEVMAVEEGDYFRQGGQKTHFTHQTDTAAGRVQAGILRDTLEGTPGQGSVMTLKLKALAPGLAEFHLVSFDGVVVGAAPVGSPQLGSLKVPVKAP